MPTLHWIGKEKVVKHHHEVPFKTLRREYTFTAPEGTPPNSTGNRIIHGDNLEALKALLPEFEGRVKCIYIDPPYNTGNEGWVYNDNVNEPRILKWLGQVVGKEGEDLSRHDKWLCMMYPRLKLLHRMLTYDGLMLISIDDYEYHFLRTIMDEICGAQRWIGTLIWKRRQATDSRNKNGVSADHEYVLVYGKGDSSRFVGQAKDLTKYTNPDNDPRGPWMSDNLTGLAGPQERPNLHYDVVNPDNGKKYPPHPTRGWIYGKDRMEALIQDGRLLWPKSDSGRPRLKRFIFDSKSETTGFSTLLNAAANIEGTKILNEMLGEKVFAFPKPPGFVDQLIQQVSNKDSIILDSFAGSGTTAHAVLKLNAEDGGNRRFILVEMLDYAETITAERVRRVIGGYGEGEKTVAGLGAYSAASRPPIPIQVGHPFRSKSATYSD
jgi:adenine-specific DNA-methyltransferase